MLQRLFRNKATIREGDDSHLLLESQSWQPTPLRQDHVRILFCQDAGESNKTILYDSDYYSGDTKSSPPTTPLARSWNGSQHQMGRTKLEVGSLKDDWRPSYMRTMPSLSIPDQARRQNNRRLDLTGDMIFGTAPLAYKGMNTKVHYYKRDKDPQIVISKLFTLNSNNNSNSTTNHQHQHQHQHQHHNDVTRRTSFSSVNSDRSTASFNTSIMTCEDNTSEQSSDDDRYSTSSIYPPILGLKNSLYSKRSRRFSQTNMENGIFSPTPLPSAKIGAPTVSSAMGADASPVRQTSRSVKYAVAIVITLENRNQTLNDFIFSHFALIENRLHQLQAVAFKQLFQYFKSHPIPHNFQPRKRPSTYYLNPNTFQNDPTISHAAIQFKQYFFDLYSTPRIQEPLWLNMSTFPQRKNDYEISLIRELADLIVQFDNKAHNYLISTLLTAVLMHHLSWVHTVAPPEDDMKKSHLSSSCDQHIGCHHGNYDPLWAQLSDLYGFVGTPSRITRTIVAGVKSQLVRKILYILSYFIRCNEVYDNTETRSSDSRNSMFYHERGGFDDSNTNEYNIARHLTGDVESIAIPPNKTNFYEPHSSVESNNSSTFSRSDHEDWSPHLSSSADPMVFDPLLDLPLNTSSSGSYLVDMPKSTVTQMEPDITKVNESGIPTTKVDKLFAKSYGRSLMASYCERYKSDFALMGVAILPPLNVIENDLTSMLEQFTLTDAVTEASCLVIDTNDYTCRVLNHHLGETNQSQWQSIQMSNLVHGMLNNIKQKYDTCNPEELVNEIEDQLQLIYLYSTMLQDIVRESAQHHPLVSPLDNAVSLATQLGLNENDIPLLLNICSTYDSKIWEYQRLFNYSK